MMVMMVPLLLCLLGCPCVIGEVCVEAKLLPLLLSSLEAFLELLCASIGESSLALEWAGFFFLRFSKGCFVLCWLLQKKT